MIPGTDGTSTRPTKGGIAYPFSLKVDGQSGHSANASMVTLQSMNLATPPAAEDAKELGNAAPGHLSFAAPGAGLFSGQWVRDDEAGAELPTPGRERPGVERFETAREDLGTFDGRDKRG